jgi:hypothetical protein
MNNAMCAVNDLEAALTQAKRRARQVESQQKQLCQARCGVRRVVVAARLTACGAGGIRQAQPWREGGAAYLQPTGARITANVAHAKRVALIRRAALAGARQTAADEGAARVHGVPARARRARGGESCHCSTGGAAYGELGCVAAAGPRAPACGTAHGLRHAGGAVVDTELLSQCSDLASHVVEAESAKLRADHLHAIEARQAPRGLLGCCAAAVLTLCGTQALVNACAGHARGAAHHAGADRAGAPLPGGEGPRGALLAAGGGTNKRGTARVHKPGFRAVWLTQRVLPRSLSSSLRAPNGRTRMR